MRVQQTAGTAAPPPRRRILVRFPSFLRRMPARRAAPAKLAAPLRRPPPPMLSSLRRALPFRGSQPLPSQRLEPVASSWHVAVGHTDLSSIYPGVGTKFQPRQFSFSLPDSDQAHASGIGHIYRRSNARVNDQMHISVIRRKRYPEQAHASFGSNASAIPISRRIGDLDSIDRPRIKWKIHTSLTISDATVRSIVRLHL